MHEVRVYDRHMELKQIISVKELIIRMDEQFELGDRPRNKDGSPRGVPIYRTYICRVCSVRFESNSPKGAIYCPKCRKLAYERSRIRKNNINQGGSNE